MSANTEMATHLAGSFTLGKETFNEIFYFMKVYFAYLNCPYHVREDSCLGTGSITKILFTVLKKISSNSSMATFEINLCF